MSLAFVYPLFSLLLQPAQPAAGPTPSVPRPTAAPSPTSSRTIVGEILAVDSARRQITLVESIKSTRPDDKKRESVTVSLDAGTQLIRGNQRTTLEEVRPKDQAVVRYLETPTGARAISVRVAAPAVKPTPSPAASPASP